MTTKPRSKTTTGTNRRPRKKVPTAEARYIKIQEAAFYLAEKDGFRKAAVEYWLEAETKAGA